MEAACIEFRKRVPGEHSETQMLWIAFTQSFDEIEQGKRLLHRFPTRKRYAVDVPAAA
jgi:hypothetical protein